MSDGIYDKLAQVSAREIADALAQGQALPPDKRAAADINQDGQVDTEDVEMAAAAQLDLANKISGAIVGMEPLSEAEARAAERNQDGHINLTDSYRLADDSRDARRKAAQLKRNHTGPLPPV
ncbi:MAG: hypothetical protein VKP62_04950 [Candidatus Sericytochromatia bacterium]|nr:hypothetical protein [Candidatus Sericytochromatia bacterium]